MLLVMGLSFRFKLYTTIYAKCKRQMERIESMMNAK